MLRITDTNSLSNFTQNSGEHVRRLCESGKPELLTVNGEAALVVQDAAAYQELLSNIAKYLTKFQVRRDTAIAVSPARL